MRLKIKIPERSDCFNCSIVVTSFVWNDSVSSRASFPLRLHLLQASRAYNRLGLCRIFVVFIFLGVFFTFFFFLLGKRPPTSLEKGGAAVKCLQVNMELPRKPAALLARCKCLPLGIDLFSN